MILDLLIQDSEKVAELLDKLYDGSERIGKINRLIGSPIPQDEFSIKCDYIRARLVVIREASMSTVPTEPFSAEEKTDPKRMEYAAYLADHVAYVDYLEEMLERLEIQLGVNNSLS